MSDDEFNPDTFDWGGETQGIDLDEAGPNVVEDAIRAAMNAHEEKYGWKYLKKSDRKEGAGRLFRVRYYMPKEGQEFFEENFPGYTFIWDGAMGHHDHPVAHLARELNELEMVEELVRNNTQYLDLYGNEKRNARYKRNCLTGYTLATPKDYIRYREVGPTMWKVNMEELCDGSTAIGKIKEITCTHALYYLNMQDIGRLLSAPGRRLRAIIHRHKETHGFLNAGEQEYWVDEKMMVTQVNVATGEKYQHPSLEGLFHQGSARTRFGGVAWTIRAGGGDTFHVEFVGCPNEICEEYVPLRFLKPESWEEYEYSNLKVRKFMHWTWMSATTIQGKKTLEDVDLFSKLRRYVAGKQRTPRLKTETMNYARRLCNKADIVSIHGGGAHEIPVASMTDYVEVAFHVDQRNELELALAFNRDNKVITQALNSYYENGVTPADFTTATKVAVVGTKTFSDAAVAVINRVRESGFITADEYVRNNLPDGDLARDYVASGDPGHMVPGCWW